MVKSNELNKGDRVKLANGWEARLEDNQRRSSTRLATVYGLETEMGSVYTHDIVARLNPDGTSEPVEHSEAQTQLRARVRALGF